MRWHAAAQSGLVEQWQRTPVLEEHPEAGWGHLDLSAFFEPTSVMLTELNIGRVLGENSWQTWTSH